MITREELVSARSRAAEMIEQAGITVRPWETEQIEVADFGLGELEKSGVQILTLVDTDRIAVKLLVLFSHQTEPEHKHPPLGDYPGKEETLRCELGQLYLYTPGEPTAEPKASVPPRKETYTVWHEHVLHPGQQVTLEPNEPHWFQGGPGGAVVWCFSTKAIDVEDVFTDQDVRRETIVLDE